MIVIDVNNLVCVQFDEPQMEALRVYRDKFVAKVPGPVTGVTSPPTLSAHTRNR